MIELQWPQLPRDARINLAFSGGLDSTVLLHLLAKQARDRLRAIHIHHGLQDAADAWCRHCADACRALQIPFIELRVTVDAGDGAGPEAAARRARYEALRGQLNAGDVLVTAHHRDDQAETVLLRLLRGSGVRGLAAMRSLSDFAPGLLWRPLLDVPRTALREYAESQGLKWIEDPQNRDPRYARSWLRGEVMPQLQKHFPHAAQSLARAALLAGEASDLLDELAAIDCAGATHSDGMSVAALLAMSMPRRHNSLRFWLRAQGFMPPAADLLARVTDEVLVADPSADPRFAWGGCELRRYRDRLFAMRILADVPSAPARQWISGCHFDLGDDCGSLQAERSPPCVLTIRRARDGERLRSSDCAHQRRLKNLFQEAGIPPWVRVRTPVIEFDGELAAVAGIGGSARWCEFQRSSGWQPHWHHGLRGAASPLAL